MMSSAPLQVILADSQGVPVIRWTLQGVGKDGRTLSWVPEGSLRVLGSGAAYHRKWFHRGFRRRVSLQWNYGVESLRETYSGGAWVGGQVMLTAEAHAEILEWASLYTVTVITAVSPPFAAKAYEQGLSLTDTLGIAHPSLVLVLDAVILDEWTRPLPSMGWGIGEWGTAPWGK